MSLESLTIFQSEQLALDPAILRRALGNAEIKLFSSLHNITGWHNSLILVVTPEQATLLDNGEINPLASDWVMVVIKDKKDEIVEQVLTSDRLAGVQDRDCSDDAMFAVMKASQALLQGRHQQHSSQMLADVLEVGRALIQEKDLDALLGLILSYARKLTGADGASIYTRDKDGSLYFRLWQNQSTEIVTNAQKTLVGDYSIASHVAHTQETIVIDDAYAIPKKEKYTFNPASDRSIGYHTQSVLTTPLTSKEDEVVGVLQLINRKTRSDVILKTEEDCHKYVIPFDKQSQAVAQALAGQAGVALENSMLYSDIERLFDGFIKASVQAIEARDPTTAGHSFRVAGFSNQLARAVDHASSHGLGKIRFSKEELKELHYAALLHDFGKVGVRENILVKADKLYPHEIAMIGHRVGAARHAAERKFYQQLLTLHESGSLSAEEIFRKKENLKKSCADEMNRLQGFLELVLKANKPSVSYEEVSDLLKDVATYRFIDDNGEAAQLVDDYEFTGLSVAKGSLSTDERKQIESHVSHTFAFLSLIPWTRNLANLPHIAHGHHEKLDGSGYPLGLTADELPVQTRIMTISDIYDALTASDRPYKKALPVERALDILAQEVDAGKLDGRIFNVFVESKAYRLPASTVS